LPLPLKNASQPCRLLADKNLNGLQRCLVAQYFNGRCRGRAYFPEIVAPHTGLVSNTELFESTKMLIEDIVSVVTAGYQASL